MVEKINSWGGNRPNAGRPKGTVKPEGDCKQHQLHAYEDEWELIKDFARIVKKGRARAARMMKLQ